MSGGRFISQLDAPCHSVNTWPVLASPGDDVDAEIAIVLPDHSQIAPESRGNLFDNTEIEEALVLHVQALSDVERAALEEQDPAVRDDRMCRRRDLEELLNLHGRVEVRDPVTRAAAPVGRRAGPHPRPARGGGGRCGVPPRREGGGPAPPTPTCSACSRAAS